MADYSLLGRGFSVADSLSALGMGQQQRVRNDELQRQAQLREATTAAYDPNTGQYDQRALTNAYAGAGDVQGAMSLQANERQQKLQQFKQAQDQLDLTAQLLGGVRDEASYQAARMQAQQLGLDVSKVPPQYNPQWVETTRTQALSVKDQLAAEQAKWLVVPNGGAVVNVRDPNAIASLNNAPASGGNSPPPPPPGAVADLRSNPQSARQFDEIFGQGAAARVLGGAPSQGGATFPGPVAGSR